MPLKQPHTTSSRIYPHNRTALALVMVLVLALVSLFVAGREIQAKEQPSEQAPQQQYSKVVITNGEVAESNGAKVPRNEVPPKEEPSPLPVVEEEAPPTPEPAPVSNPAPVPEPVVTEPPAPEPAPAPQHFAVAIVNGLAVESDWTIPWPVPEPADPVPPEPNVIPGDAWLPPQASADPEPVPPLSEDAGSRSEPVPTVPWPVTGTENLLPPVYSDLALKTSDPALSWPTSIPEPVALQGNSPVAFPPKEFPPKEAPRVFEEAPSKAMLAPPLLDKGLIPAAPAKSVPTYVAHGATVAQLPTSSHKPLAMAPKTSSLPGSLLVSMHRMAPQAVPRPPSSLGATASAVDIVRSAAASVAEYVSETLNATPSPAPSSGETSDGTSKQPAPPLMPPAEGSFFSLLSGGGSGGQIGSAGGVAPLLVGILASGLVLLRHDRWKYLVSCDLPKPSSALLLPLERPG